LPMCPVSPLSDSDGVHAETSPFPQHERSKGHDKHEQCQRTRDSTGEEPPPKRVGAAASGLAIVLMCGATDTALGAPNEPRQVHVEGQLLPVAGKPGVYRVTGGLVGTYNLRSERVINSWTYWTTQMRYIEGTESITGCVDQNQNKSCDAGEPSGELRLNFNRVASFDTQTGWLIGGVSTHQVSSGGRFSDGY
jgi:hypothetical protein